MHHWRFGIARKLPKISFFEKTLHDYKIIVNYALFIVFRIDIEECQIDTDNCHTDSNCTNTKGSFYCTCHTGYSGNGVTCVGRDHKYVHEAQYSRTSR